MNTRRVVIACFPGMELLDASGPASVFGAASMLSGKPDYRVELAAHEPGPVISSCGVALIASRKLSRLRGSIDTLLVPGGFGPALAAASPLVSSLPALSRRARRTVSVCSGAFLLAQAGLLRGKRAATHWAGASELSRRHPDVCVEADPIFIRDGNVWTSAGVTAGLDLALALVEEDLGSALALEIARWSVMYLRRAGGQSQFSVPLHAQHADDEGIARLLRWIADNLQRALPIPVLARQAGMSVRNLTRVFVRETGSTPATYIERLRIESARRALELSDASVKQIAAKVGFASSETLHRSFQRTLSVTPMQYRERFRMRVPRRHARA
ncbi:MAG: transcriptional regulator containing an amidase domain and an AraC-type DNA-binding domain [Myxococcaceae bacterium]|nr:transcriptional regulator containing an amidase domain and an AraC-type DNA-binding domain [Myxococcaceae bacterium]